METSRIVCRSFASRRESTQSKNLQFLATAPNLRPSNSVATTKTVRWSLIACET